MILYELKEIGFVLKTGFKSAQNAKLYKIAGLN